MLEECLNKTKLYLRNIITDLQNSDTWRIQQLQLTLFFQKMQKKSV